MEMIENSHREITLRNNNIFFIPSGVANPLSVFETFMLSDQECIIR